MYKVYTGKVICGVRRHQYLHTLATRDEAVDLAKCATGGDADYAFIEDPIGGTVFFLRPPSYDPQPLTAEQLQQLKNRPLFD